MEKEIQDHEDAEQFGALQAFMEVQGYIESERGIRKVLSMTEVSNLYMERLGELGVVKSKHTT